MSKARLAKVQPAVQSAPVVQSVPAAAPQPALSMPAVHIPGVRLHAVAQAEPGQIVDRLGALKALISQLSEVEADLKAALVESGLAAVDGAVYRATVSQSDRVSLDTGAIRETMGDDWCARFERATPVTSVRVTARKRVH